MHPRATTKWFAALLAALAVLAPAAAARAGTHRDPQVTLVAASLQNYLNGRGESINITTDQIDATSWATDVSGNALFTLMIELAAFKNRNAIGVYNCDDMAHAPTLFQVFPGGASAGWFAVASFQPNGRLVVSLFDDHSAYRGQTTYNGVNSQNFGFYLCGPGGTFFSEDSRNGGNAQALVFAGTSTNAGSWWLCLEDLPYASDSSDFEDAVLLLESVTPTRARIASWGGLKALYR